MMAAKPSKLSACGCFISFLLIATLHPNNTFASDQVSCPIEQVVGKIIQIDGDQRAVQLASAGRMVLPSVGSCILYGDELKVGLHAVVTIDTAKGTRHVGGDWDPDWKAPIAHEVPTHDVSALLFDLFKGLMEASPSQTVTATARDGETEFCSLKEGAAKLAPLGHLRGQEQKIGFDLHNILVGWIPIDELVSVRVNLLDVTGMPIAEVEACSRGRAILPIAHNILHTGDRLTLEVTNGHGNALRYRISVVDPANLVKPVTTFQEDWMLAAWRLASGDSQVQLDAISRLLEAPSDSLLAQRILKAVWANTSF